MPRPHFAATAALFLSGLLLAPTVFAQQGPPPGGPPPGSRRPPPGGGIPGLPTVIEGTRPSRPEPVQPRGQLLDRAVAVVNDGIVTQSELDDAIASYIQNTMQDETQRGRRPPTPEQLRAPMLDVLISRELQLQLAERFKIPVSEDDLNDALRSVAESAKVRFDELPDAMKAQGIDYADFRADLRKQILIGRLEAREVRQHIVITPRELEQYIERLKKMPNENDEFNVSDILISVPAEPTKAQLDEALKKAQQVHELAATEDFASLAIAHSEARTKLDGGALGWRKGTELPTELAEAIVPLKAGEVSRPFLTSSGYHIVKVNELRRATGDPVKEQVQVRHILVKTTAVRDDATVKLMLSGVRQRILGGEDFAVNAQNLSQDPGSQAEGGMLEWLPPDEFEPEFAEVVRNLKDNEISEPFTTRYGWHIVQMLGRRMIDTTEDSLRERAIIQLRDNKAEEEVELWRRQIRNEAYIKILDVAS